MSDELKGYQAMIGQRFELEGAPQGVSDLQLLEARALREAPVNGARQPFSLLFRGPMEPKLPQATYILRQDDKQVEALFLVPVGPDGKGLCYEAVFN
ncbi:hypothetical protein J2T60_002661 [Natronospira proteinivora]|uniref:DUF6916 domain-containing protein n=1 Tax=Natronospira proteinivora TaxID=1807133 RepID=A0ABT1GFE1_9GAMM|nr:hypothetical protein [Natronospira proteinivora]MCP1728647.1 hypothetical protein [Natronospira proteinivora]